MLTPQQLATAGAIWAASQDRDLGIILVEQGVIDEDQRQAVAALIRSQIVSHDGDASQVFQLYGGESALQASFGGSLVVDTDPADHKYASLAGPGPVQSSHPETSDGTPVADILVAEQAGRYTLRGEQGRGGIGRVLIAYDESIRREIALKELLPSISSGGARSDPSPQRRSSTQTTRFLREARITGQLEHPGIVPVYELGQRTDGTVYYTMKLVRGVTLSEKLRACRNLTERLALLPHFLDLCQAIAYAHSRDVIHRDIKPANVMVGEFGETVLLDWGLAKVKGQADHGAEKLADEVRLLKEAGSNDTVDGKPIGTPSYMPPEQADGRIGDIDERSDVWSLGAVLYEVLTGAPPFSGANAFDVIGMVLTDEVQPVLDKCKEAPADLAAVALRCLHKAPADRYANVEQLAADVTAFQTGGLVRAYSYSTALMLRRWARKHWPVLSTAAVGLVALLLTGAIAYAHVVHQNRALSAANHKLDIGQDQLLAYKLATECNAFVGQYRTELATLLALEAGKYYRLSGGWMPDVDQALRSCANPSLFCHELAGHSGQVRRVAFSPDGQLLASCGDDSRIMLWDMSGQARPPVLLKGHTGGVACVAWSPDGAQVASAGHDGLVKLWDPVSGKAVQTLTDNADQVWAVAFSPDGKLLATGGVDKAVRVWTLAQPAAPPLVLPGTREIQVVAFSPDGKWLAAGGDDQLVRLWPLDALSAAPRVLAGHKGDVMWVAFSPDSQTLVSTASDKSVLVWDLAAPASLPRSLAGHTGAVTAAAFSRDSTQLVTAGMDQTLRLWDVAQLDQEPRTLGKLGEGIWSVAFSPDGRLLASSGGEKNVRIWELNGPEDALPLLRGHTQRIRSLAYSPDGQVLASASEDDSLRLWHPGRPLDPPQVLMRHTEQAGDDSNHEFDITSLAFTPDGSRLLAGSLDKTVSIWTLGSSDPPAVVTSPQWIRSVRVSPDGQRCLAVGGDNVARLWELSALQTAPRELRASDPEDILTSCAYCADGRHLAAAGLAGKVYLWDLAANGSTPPQVLHGCQDVVYALAFSPDARQLAAGSGDQTIRLWDVAAPESDPLALQGHRGDVLGLAFTPDGRLLCSASRDQTVQLWNLGAPGGEPEVLYGHHSGVFCVAVSPDGRQVASAGSERVIHVWPVDALDLVPLIAARPRRNLTLDEWQKYVGTDIPYTPTIAGLPTARTIGDPPAVE